MTEYTKEQGRATYEEAPVASEWFQHGQHIKRVEPAVEQAQSTANLPAAPGATNDMSQFMMFMTTVLAPHLVAQRASHGMLTHAPPTPQLDDHTLRSRVPPVSPTPPSGFDMTRWEAGLGLTTEEKRKFVHYGYDGQPLSTIATKHVVHDDEMGFKLLRWERLVYKDEKHRFEFYS